MSRAQILVLIVALLMILIGATAIFHAGASNSQLPVAYFTYSPDVPGPQDLIVFNASSSYSPNGWIVQYTWDFGDGNISTVTDPVITHAFYVDGDYTVQLTVTDNNGYTDVAVAVIPVRCVVFFRVVAFGTTFPLANGGSPLANVTVTAYYYNGSAWVKAPASNKGIEIKYDNMTQPNLANNNAERYRNPGYTASILRASASNIGFDIHSIMTCRVFFKFEFGSYVTYWPNNTTRVYTYEPNHGGVVDAHDYHSGNQAYWDPAASAYVIEAQDIAGAGVSPTESHPILIGLINTNPPTTSYCLTVRTTPLGITTIPGAGLYIANTNVTLTAPTYVNVSTTSRYRFDYWDVEGTSRGSGVNPITVFMSANHTATAHYIMQYALVFNQTGLSSDATGTIVTANGNPEAYTQLPFTLWVDSGSSVTYSYGSIVSSSTGGKQFRLSGVTGPSSPVTVTGTATITGNYVIQYQITFAQTSLDSSASGTVVTVNGNAKVYTQIPYALWVDSGSSVTYSYGSVVSSSTTGKQFRVNTVTGPSSPIITTGPTTVTGNYIVQYSVTFAQTGLDSTASGTIVTVNGSPKIFSALPYTSWFDAGSSITYSHSSIVPSSVSGKQFRLNSVTGTSSPITVTGPTTITGNYVAQYQVTFAQTGLDSTATGTVVTANSNTKTFGDLSYTLWVDSGGSVTYSYSSIVTSSASGKQFRLLNVTGPSSPITVTGPTSIIGNYKTQYYLTVTSAYDSPTPSSGWFDSGLGITESVTSPVSGGIGTQYVCTGWSGSGSVPASGSASSVTFTINVPSSITWNWKTQYYLTVVSGHGSPSPLSGWLDSGSSVTDSVTSPVSGGAGTQYVCTGWSGTGSVAVSGSGSSVTFTIGAPSSITWNWKTQYYLTVVSGHGSPSPLSGWFDSGLGITESVASPVSGGSGTQYVCTGWSGTGNVPASGSGSSVTFTLTQASSVTWNWKTQYYLTVTSVYDSPSPLSGWFDSGSSITESVTSPVSGGIGSQYVCTGWSGSGSVPASGGASSVTFTIGAPSSVTWNWKTQYQVTFDHTGVGSDFAGAVASVDSVNYGVSGLPVSFWLDSGSSHGFSFASPLIVGSKQYVWSSTSGLSTLQSGTLVVTASGSVVGNYIVQNQVTFDQVGVSSDFSGTVVIIDAVSYSKAQLPVSFSWSIGSNHGFAFQSPLIVGASSKQYVWTSTTGLSSSQSGSVTVTTYGSIIGNYKTQYYLTVTSAYDSPTPLSGWFDSGSSITESVMSPVPGGSGIQYVCSGWTGTGSVPASGGASSVTFAIGAPSSITWNWKTQCYLAVTSPYDSPSPGSGWFDSGSGITESVTSPVSGGAGIQYVCTGWTGTGSVAVSGSGLSVTFTIGAPSTITWNWKTQYYLTVTSAYDSPTPLSGWFDSGSSITESVMSPVPGGSGIQYVCSGWTGTGSVPASGGASSVTFTIGAPSSIVWNWKTQYYLTVTSPYDSPTPLSGWFDSGSSVAESVTSPTPGPTGTQYVCLGWSGSGSVPASGGASSVTFTIGAPSSVTWNWKTQYYLTVTSVYDSPSPLSGWFDSGSGITESVTSPVSGGAGIQYVCTGWTGTGSVAVSGSGSSVTFTISAPSSITWNWKTQYQVTFDHSGLDSSASSTVATVNGAPITYGQLPYGIWVDSGDSITYSYNNVSSSTPGKRFILIGVTGLPSPITVTSLMTVTGNYKTQYQVTFSQTGVDSDFTGTVVTVDSNGYAMISVPFSFWWDDGSSHTFSFYSPLGVNDGEQYNWISTSGLTILRSGSLSVEGSGTVTGNYAVEYKYQVRFDQTGVNTEFAGTVVIIDGVNYAASALPVSFWWNSSLAHTFAYQSPLVVTSNGKQYVWTSTSGLSSAQSGSMTATTSGSIIGNYKTQYYLSVATSPLVVTSPSGAGWYDAGTNATISTTAFVDIVPGSSRYRFNGWTAADMTEIEDITRSPTTVSMDQGKTVTATYVVQYNLTFNQVGVGSDFSATIVIVDGINYTAGGLPVSFMWDNGSIHTFSFVSPLSASKQYAWMFTSGLSTSQADSITVSASGNVAGNYGVTYTLTITATTGGATNPAVGTHVYPSGSTVQVTALPYTNYQLDHWELDSVSVGAGNPYSVLMSTDHTLNAVFKPVTPALSVSINPLSGVMQVGQSLTFNSIISGGVSPYSYQWYLDGIPFTGATSSSWTWTPQHASMHLVYVKVTDSNGATAQSELATISVTSTPVPVGGYSISFARPSVLMSIVAYVAVAALSAAVLSARKRKRK